MERPGEENKLFVGCLPSDITEEDLRFVFGNYGEVSNVHLMNSKISERGHACAFVSYTRPESAEDAIAVLDGKYKIRDTPDAEFLKVGWKRQGDKSSGKGGDKGGGWSGGQKGGSSWSGGQQQDSWKSNTSGWNQGHQPPANQWGSPQNSSWGSSPPSQSWNSGGGNAWNAGGNSWQDSNPWGGKGKGGNDWGQSGGKGYGKGGNDYAQGGGKGQDWKGGGQGGQDWKGGGGKSAPEPTNRVFVGNLPSDIGEESLTYVFSTYGKVGSVHIMAGKAKSGQSCAFIEYATVEEAETAIATLNEKYEIRPGDGPILVKFGNSKGSGKGKSSPY